MELSLIKELVKKPANGAALNEARYHAMRLRFHTDTSTTPDRTGYMSDFLRFVGGYVDDNGKQQGGILPADKFDTFSELITYPLPTVEFSESIHVNLNRVFTGKNSIERYLFDDQEKQADFVSYFKSQKFKELASEAMFSDIDTVMVVDMPPEKGEKKFPAPYFYFVPTDRIIDLTVDSEDRVLYIIYKDGNGKTVCIDGERWTVCTGEEADKLSIETDVPHNLGFTPARMLWTDRLKAGNYINRKSPITGSLGELDWLLFHKISKRHLDLYAAYPVTITYKADEPDPKKPSEPKGKKMRGAGSNLTVPAPQSKDDPDLMNNPMKVFPAERQSLDYNVSEDDRLTDRIFKACVGYDGEPSNDQAQNEKQIISSFESRKDILMRLKKNFENAQKWLADTLGLLRYREYYKGSEIDYGSEFYLQSEDQVLDSLKSAKTEKAPDVVISDLTDKYFHTKYRTDSATRERVQIIMNLDPYPTRSVEEVVSLFSQNIVDKETAILKVNLDAFIKRFERENGSLTEFGKKLEFNTKISIINQKLLEYGKEKISGLDSGEPDAEIPD